MKTFKNSKLTDNSAAASVNFNSFCICITSSAPALRFPGVKT